MSIIDVLRRRWHGLLGGGGSSTAASARLPREGELPPLAGAIAWLNSEPLTTDALLGRVVLVQFWTYTCINWIRTLPYVRAWADKYRDDGLVVIGVHTPEFPFEHDVENVRRAATLMGRPLPHCHRQRLRGLAGVRQCLLAGPLLRRRQRSPPAPSLRRGRVRRVGARTAAIAGRGRRRRRRP